MSDMLMPATRAGTSREWIALAVERLSSTAYEVRWKIASGQLNIWQRIGIELRLKTVCYVYNSR